MKVSRRIAQFLLVLLKYENVYVDYSKSPLLRSSLFQLERFFYQRTHGLVPSEYGHFKASRALRNSFPRTIRIMRRQGLISQDSYLDITLTEKGRKAAIAFEEEARKYIESFSFLLNYKPSENLKYRT